MLFPSLTVSPPHPPYGGVRSYLNKKNHKKSIVHSIQNLNIPEHAQRVALPTLQSLKAILEVQPR